MLALFWDEINITNVLHTLSAIYNKKHYFGSNYYYKLKALQ